MSLNINDYVQITSGVAAANQVANRQFIGRIFTTNSIVSPSSVLEFASAVGVGAFFGTNSEEYIRAIKYFGYISPDITTPGKLSFARYVSIASPASIFGAKNQFSLTTIQLTTAGVIQFSFGDTQPILTAGSFVSGNQYQITTVGTTDYTLIGAASNTVGTVFTATGVGAGTGTATSTGIVTVSGINLSGSSSLTNAAALMQTALRANGDERLTTCTVSYDAVNSRFDFVATNASITAGSFSTNQAGTGVNDLSSVIGWYASSGAIITSSSPSQSPLDSFISSVSISNNFGSFCFTTTSALTLAQSSAIALQNENYNVMFIFHIVVTPSTYASWSAALISIASTGITYQLATLNEYPEMLPMAIQAATNYSQRNGVMNFMYKQIANLTASVTDDSVKTALDAARVNYYGQTQQAGQQVSFYQNGMLCGLAVNPQAMNIHANEQWLKDDIASRILNFQLSVGQISAGSSGLAQITTLLNASISNALFNGVIASGKQLTTVQQLYITQLTGINTSWIQVQNAGYWFTVNISSSVDPNTGLTIYTANYTLIYSKNDAVQKIVGTHVLI